MSDEQHPGEPRGGLFDIDIFGKVIGGLKSATAAQKTEFIRTVIPIVHDMSDADKAAFREALGIKP